MAKHGEKKILFNFDDLQFAAFFLDFIKKKKFYAQVIGSMNQKQQLEFKIRGSADQVKIAVQKIISLYHKALDIYKETNDIPELRRLNDMESDEDSNVESDIDFEDENRYQT